MLFLNTCNKLSLAGRQCFLNFTSINCLMWSLICTKITRRYIQAGANLDINFLDNVRCLTIIVLKANTRNSQLQTFRG